MVDVLQRCIDGLSHHRAGRLCDAEISYRSILADASEQPQALHYLALLLLATRRPAEAASCWRRVLVADPDHLPALVNLANALRASGDLAAALAACDVALTQYPHCADAHASRGATLLANERVADAVAAYRTAVALEPASATVQAGLALALLRAGDAAAALEAADAATACDGACADGWFARGTALHALGHLTEAQAALADAIARAPEHAQAHLNLGNVLDDLDESAAAEASLRRSIALAPELAEARASLAVALTNENRIEEALAICDEALPRHPGFAPLHWARANALLLNGDFGLGLPEYEWRLRDSRFGGARGSPRGRRWEGEDLAGRMLLVRGEQGLGDTIQMSRYLPLLAARGARVVLACVRSLTGVLGQLGDTVDCDAPLPRYDAWIDQMSLPRCFGTRVDTIPAASGYLRADPDRRAHWTNLLAELCQGQARRIGLAWAGNPAHRNDRRRSMPATALRGILATPGCCFVSLQLGPAGDDAGHRLALHDETRRLRSFADTAALVASLDLVITVDTAVAHLAGALGCPVWVMLPYAPDWRWVTGRDDSPWYNSMRLFRQTRPGDWTGPTAAVGAALARCDGPVRGRPGQAASFSTSAGAMRTSAS